MVSTPNTGSTPDANADFVYLLDANGTPVANLLTNVTLPSIRAHENGTVSADIFGMFGSLDLTRIDNVTGDGFLDVSLTNDLGGPPSTATPEPATLTLLAGGTLILAAWKRLRQ